MENNYIKTITMAMLFFSLGTLQLMSQDCSPNLLQNPNGEEGMNHWNIVSGRSDGWNYMQAWTMLDGFSTSYGSCPEIDARFSKAQLVDLVAGGYSPNYLDTQPNISVGENISTWFANAFCFNGVTALDPYYVRFELRDANQNVLASYLRGSPTKALRAPIGPGVNESVVFSDYGTGARYVYFEHGGADSGFWENWYGSRFKDGYVLVTELDGPNCNPSVSCPPDVQVANINESTGTAEVTQSTEPCCNTVSAHFSDEYLYNEGCSMEILRTWSTNPEKTGSKCIQRIKVANTCRIICPTNTCVSTIDAIDPAEVGSPRATAGCTLNDLSYTDLENSECTSGDQIVRTWTATVDGLSSCKQVCAQVISINDDTPPTISNCPDDFLVNTTADVVNWEEPVALDNCQRVVLGSTHSPGSTFPVGTATVVYTASDYCGNQTTCSFFVSVLFDDNDNCPEDVVVYADADGMVNWEAPSYMGSCETCHTVAKAGFDALGSFGGSSYYISKDKYYYSDATHAVARAGGHLVSISSEEENDYLSSSINSPVLIGLTDYDSEGTFHWANGEALGYTNWYVNQPNDHKNNQDFVEMLPRGQWNDMGNYKRYIVLEIPCEYVVQVSGPTNGTAVDPGTYEVSYSMTDGCGMESACTYTITVMGHQGMVSQNTNKINVLTQDNTVEVNVIDKNIIAPQLDQQNIKDNFIIYPNPASHQININFDKANYSTSRKVVIYDKMGRQIFTKTTDQDLLIVDTSTNNFHSGYYFVTVQNGQNFSTQKIVILK